ncbi:hypothetical protein DVK85_09005 [Flavobacterium arcticum]|uniref:Uncharacterized protein n=1 Tax=Flavobacterium arcticum TaxID=1784713 RepID=A0A345HCQ1_9FLAO|nr:hypothetical protein [Flavobacterium arcticum]AXG74361.1 hypothetical protein DVK85_09005 [Flavobacterium arcticum]KAF2507524.1 hypothetical protein E0W72_11645 [Flavobacterium arcticum]
MEKGKWIAAVMNSTEGIRKITPHEGMYDIIQAKLYNKEARVPQQTIWMAASSILLLATLNIITIRKIVDKEETQITSTAASSQSPLYVNNQLY